MENVEIARTLEDVADLLEIQGSNPFRVRAYRNAARTIEEHPVPMRKLVEEDADLTELPGIGEDMSKYIHQLVDTGSLELLDELTGDVPYSLIEIGRLPGVGPKKTRKLWKELGIETVDQLEEAAKAGKVRELEGFGEKSEEKILQGIEAYRRHQARFKISEADQHVLPLLEWLREDDSVERIEVAGSYRRRKETVGDIDLLAIAEEGASLMERFTSYDRVEEVLASGATKGSVRLASGLQVDLRILTAKSYGAALVYFTGSKEHNVRLRQRAIDRGLRISEYGVFEVEKGKRGKDEDEEARERDPWEGEFVAGATEEEVYAAVDLPWIPPELREDRGEIQAAEKDELPELITLEDLRGDLQMHSTWSDGRESIETMLEACAERGYEYFALTDHSQSLAMTGGMDEKKLRRQWKEMDEVVAEHDEIHLFRSMEIDILADGTLDLSDESAGEARHRPRLDPLALQPAGRRADRAAPERSGSPGGGHPRPPHGPPHQPEGPVRVRPGRGPRARRRARRGRGAERPPGPPRPQGHAPDEGEGARPPDRDRHGRPPNPGPGPHPLRDRPGAARVAHPGGRAQHPPLEDLRAWLDAPREERAKHWRELPKGARKKKSSRAAAAKREKKSGKAKKTGAKAKKGGSS